MISEKARLRRMLKEVAEPDDLIHAEPPYEVEPSNQVPPTADIAAKARDFTVRVECWK